ncbi:MAG: PrgI family protein [Dehalococcoidia bacterium]|nr:MAG: PrgI family protein [Dehalococcoidia bacterium]
MERHEIPTHLNTADRAFLGLTMRQLLSAAVGLALAYGATSDLPLPLALRLVAAAVVLVATLVLVFWRPAGRPAEEWAFVVLRFWATPRVAVWRPRDPMPDRSEGLREVVLPTPVRPEPVAPALEGSRS